MSCNDTAAVSHGEEEKQQRKVVTLMFTNWQRKEKKILVDQEDLGLITEAALWHFYKKPLSYNDLGHFLENHTCLDDTSGDYRIVGLKGIDLFPTFGRHLPGHLPPSVGLLSALKYIKFDSGETLFEENWREESIVVLPCLERLEIDGTLHHLPSNIGSFSSLQKIQIINCSSILALPESFVLLTSLKEFVAAGTPIQHLPDGFGALGQLEVLNMDFCELDGLPPDFGLLTCLHTLRTGWGAFDFPFPHLPALRNLTTLSSGLRHFDQTGTVHSLYLSYGFEGTNTSMAFTADLNYISSWCHLESLTLDALTDTNDGYALPKGFLALFPKMKELCVYGDSHLSIYMEDVYLLDQLKVLSLHQCRLLKVEVPDNGGVLKSSSPPLLRKLKQVRFSNMAEGFTDILLATRMPFIEELHLQNCTSVNDVFFWKLCEEWFPHLSCLRSLGLKCCGLTKFETFHHKALSKLEINSMFLDGNPIVDRKKTVEEVDESLLPLLQLCPSLTALVIDARQIGNERISDTPRIAHGMALNVAKGLVLGKQHVPRGLWPLVFENASKCVRPVILPDLSKCVQPVIHSDLYSRFQDVSDGDRIYTLLKERAASDLYS